jgi:hypothetical protein
MGLLSFMEIVEIAFEAISAVIETRPYSIDTIRI